LFQRAGAADAAGGGEKGYRQQPDQRDRRADARTDSRTDPAVGAGRHALMFTRRQGNRAVFCYAEGMRLGRLASLLLLPALSTAGCGAIGFDVSQTIPMNMIMGDPMPDLAAVDAKTPLTINIDAEAEKQGALANSAWLKSLTFTITTPNKGTFYFVSGVTISIAADAAGLKEIPIARLMPVPNQQTISITPIPGVELLPYARAGASIRATAVGVFPKEDTTYVGSVVIHVNI
jgi:hypothetical protein